MGALLPFLLIGAFIVVVVGVGLWLSVIGTTVTDDCGCDDHEGDGVGPHGEVS